MCLKEKGMVPKNAMVALFILFFFTACRQTPVEEQMHIEGLATESSLAAHTQTFAKGIERVGDNVFVAVGYGLANSVMIEGVDGVIVVDTMESVQQAEQVLAEFRKISEKPVKAIVYTHNHTDHIFGAGVFSPDGSVPVYAHERTDELVSRLVNRMRPIIGARSMRMFGNYLDEDGLENAGIGPFLGIGPHSTLAYLPPTVTFADRLSASVAGVEFELIHAPGETDDQLYLWLPKSRVLLCGDNFYRSFPNLYTIRGTPYRSLKNWYRSLDIARELAPEHLVSGHGRPVSGAADIQTALTDYRDAIQYVHDQGIRGINMGMTPDQLVENVKLPPHLASSPYLQEFYGKVSWSLRALFSGNLGWFDGDAATLQPLSPVRRAEIMAELAGGTQRLVEQAAGYMAIDDPQAALELTGHILKLTPGNRQAKEIRTRALVALGSREQNANARHYYLTEALEIRDAFVASADTVRAEPEMLARMPLEAFFEGLAVNLDPVKSADMQKAACIRFPEEHKDFTISIRRGVAEIRPVYTQGADIVVVAEAQAFKEMLARIRNPVTTLIGFHYAKGNTVSFGRFMKLFDPGVMKLAFEPCVK
jgi:alkyl sulfatase BDS1-like metallo-beta-lactamase superfamily hydrolase